MADSWRNIGAAGGVDSDSSESDGENKWLDEDMDTPVTDFRNVPLDIAQEELVTFLLMLQVSNTLSAKQVCVLAFWIKACGGTGPVCKLALRPDAQTGKFMRKIDAFLGSKPADVPSYEVPTVRRFRTTASRTLADVATIPPHEAIAEELASSPHASEALARANADGDIPPFIARNPAYMEAVATGVDVHPIALYLDGVNFQRQDSVLGFWCYVLYTGKRHLLAVIRRSEVCSCGCRGWCTLQPLFAMLAWSFASMVRGVWPSARHDGPFGATDATRALKANQPLGWKAVCVIVKGDWAEYCHSLGLPTWRDGISPCPLCFTSQHEFYDFDNVSCDGHGIPRKTGRAYDAACSACEIALDLDLENDLTAVKAALRFMKGRSGQAGLLLNYDIPHLGLKKGDRLESSAMMPDVASIFLCRAPVPVTFWRASEETLARRRNPLFGLGTGLTIEALAVDTLHALALGVYQAFIIALVWALIEANAWGIAAGSAIARHELSTYRVREELFAWYKREDRAGRSHPKVNRFHGNTFGTQKKKKCRMHGAATTGFLYFAVFLLTTHGHHLGRMRGVYRQGLDALVAIQDAIKAFPGKFPDVAKIKFAQHVSDHLEAVVALGMGNKPKHHMLIELASRLHVAMCINFH